MITPELETPCLLENSGSLQNETEQGFWPEWAGIISAWGW